MTSTSTFSKVKMLPATSLPFDPGGPQLTTVPQGPCGPSMWQDALTSCLMVSGSRSLRGGSPVRKCDFAPSVVGPRPPGAGPLFSARSPRPMQAAPGTVRPSVMRLTRYVQDPGDLSLPTWDDIKLISLNICSAAGGAHCFVDFHRGAWIFPILHRLKVDGTVRKAGGYEWECACEAHSV